MKTHINNSIKEIVQACITCSPQSQHLSLLKEFHGFTGISNFSQTIKDLISINQMSVFGISHDMQNILKHINQLKMLSSITTITKMFQKEYEQMHKRTVVIVSIAKDQEISVDEIIQFLTQKISQSADFIFKLHSTLGITVQFNNSIIQYTPDSIMKMLKIA